MGYAKKRTLAILLVAAVALQFSVVLLAVLLVVPTDGSATLVLMALGLAGLILGLGVALAAALRLVADPPPTRPAPTPVPPPPVPVPAPAPEPQPSPENGDSTVINPRRRPASPGTPADAELQERNGQWATASTPWQRADEDDPDGTLIRPPHR